MLINHVLLHARRDTIANAFNSFWRQGLGNASRVRQTLPLNRAQSPQVMPLNVSLRKNGVGGILDKGWGEVRNLKKPERGISGRPLHQVSISQGHMDLEVD